jgi:hypothetical protein
MDAGNSIIPTPVLDQITRPLISRLSRLHTEPRERLGQTEVDPENRTSG